MNQNQSTSGGRLGRILRWGVKSIIPLVVLIAAIAGARWMLSTTPETQRRPQERLATLVDVETFSVSTQPVVLDTAMGEVQPARTLELKPQVSGRVEWLSPELQPGAVFRENAELMRIEAVDYELAVSEQQAAIAVAEAELHVAQASVVTAENDLAIEMGNQRVAQRESELLGEPIDETSRDLILRVPQLKAAEAAVQSAEAALESAQASYEAAQAGLAQAELDLKRTTIQSPYNTVVAEKMIDIGDVVSSTAAVLTLCGTDEFWIELSIPSSQTQWVEPGVSRVKLTSPVAWGEGQSRDGLVIRILPHVDSGGRMARVLVSIKDPLSTTAEHAGDPILLVNDYMSANIIGRTVEDVIALPRSLVREGDTVWVMNEQNELDIRPIKAVYRGRSHVLISGGLQSGERVVTTDIAAPVQGMPLRESDTEGGAS